MNKYQAALNNVKIAPSFMGGNDEYRRHLDSAVPFLKDIAILQELVDKETPKRSVKSMNYNYAEKYIKKPIVIEAFHYRKGCTDWPDLRKFGPEIVGADEQNNPIIKTLEGEVSLYDDCYVIKGIEGEFYPCKKEIFEKIYESIKEHE